MRDEELTAMPTGATTTTTPKANPLAPIFNVPGVVWIGLIAALTKWVNDSFPDQPWAPAVVIVLGGIAKLVQMYWPKGETAPAPTPAAAPGPVDGDDCTYRTPAAPKESNGRKVARLLVG